MLQQIVKWIGDKKIFCRKRKINEERALGMLLYHASLSYEKTGFFVEASHEAVREWVAKGRELFYHHLIKESRKRIAVDEKIIKSGKQRVYLWAAVDLDREKVIAVFISQGGSYMEALQFLKRVKRVCKGKLPRVCVDGGKWYPWAFERLGFRYTITNFGSRSAIERFFSLVVWRIRRFWEYFPSNATVQSVERWCEAFAGVTNYLRRC